MNELLERARREGLWLYCSYQSLWFTPGELEEHQRNGRFVWGPVNWQLRNPIERLEELERNASDARKAVEMFRAKINGGAK